MIWGNIFKLCEFELVMPGWRSGYRASLENSFPQGFPGSNPGPGVFLFFEYLLLQQVYFLKKFFERRTEKIWREDCYTDFEGGEVLQGGGVSSEVYFEDGKEGLLKLFLAKEL